MTAAALYMRVYRRRQAEGKLIVPVELDATDIDLLIEAKTLDGRREYHTREAIAAAIRDYLRISRYV